MAIERYSLESAHGAADILFKRSERATDARLHGFRRRPFTVSALILCIAFGLALIANIQEADEGSWFWYADLLRRGHRLYSDLNLPLQPWFPLELAWFQRLFGETWIASKIPAAIHLTLFSLGIFLLATKSTWRDRQNAVVMFCTFFFGIHFEAYRFDDYHVVADAAFLFSALLLLQFGISDASARRYTLSAGLGMLAGITFLTRANDGALLFVYDSAIIILVASRTRWYASLVIFAGTFAALVAFVVSLTGDSLVVWATKTLLHVGEIKGGNNEFLADPARIVTTSWASLMAGGFAVIAEALAAVVAWVFLIGTFSLRHASTSIAKASIGLLIVAVASAYLIPQAKVGEPELAFLAFGSIAAYTIAFVVLVRALVHLVDPGRWVWNSAELLLILPFVMNVSGSLSSAGSFNDHYFSVAVLILLLPMTTLFPMTGRIRSTYLLFAALLAGTSAWYRYDDPASWISYKTFPLFTERQIVNHSAYGPMIIDARLKRFVDQVCAIVHDGDPKPELLSIPWAYPNYYCAVPPWHNFVQTWYDTTPRAVANTLIDELRFQPPEWIIYQQELSVLAFHEYLYNEGQPLPQRTIDDLIMKRVDLGQWRVAYRYADPGEDSTWILMRTRSPQSPGPNLLANLSGKRGLAGWQSVDEFPTWSLNGRKSGTFTITNSGPDASESIMAAPVLFAHDGTVSIQSWIAADGMSPKGGYGYTIDMYDASTDIVVGSLGYASTDAALRGHLFTANVRKADRYQIRLRYEAAAGSVSFSRIAIRDGRAKSPWSDTAGTYRNIPQPAAWSASSTRPTWAADPRAGGSFIVTHAAGSATKSTLYGKLRFGRSGPVSVRLRIGADVLDVQGGFGYVVDLYDETTRTVAGSLGVPAVASEPREYSFTAAVRASDAYRLRLRFDAGRAHVSFSHLIVEYGANAAA